MKVMILHSEDGQEYAHAILYPDDWQEEQADALAVEAFEAGQKANPEEWSWDKFEPELIKRGFTIPYWHHGPIWAPPVRRSFTWRGRAELPEITRVEL